jgi:hypothetical protein
MQLRLYQVDAKHAAYNHLREHPGRNPLIVLPSGGGKSPLIAGIFVDAAKAGRRALVLCHLGDDACGSVDKRSRVIYLTYSPIGAYSDGWRTILWQPCKINCERQLPRVGSARIASGRMQMCPIRLFIASRQASAMI